MKARALSDRMIELVGVHVIYAFLMSCCDKGMQDVKQPGHLQKLVSESVLPKLPMNVVAFLMLFTSCLFSVSGFCQHLFLS